MTATRDDIGEVLGQIAAERPAFVEGNVTKEHIAWAIGSLERHGIHPDRSYVKAILGRRLPRETIRHLSEIYVERATSLAKTPPDDPEIQEAYAVLRRHARRRVELEMQTERADLDQRALELEETSRKLLRAERTADEKSRAADLLRETLSKELNEGRQERVQLVLSLAAATGELAEAKANLASTHQQLSGLAEERAELQASVDSQRAEALEYATGVAALHAAVESCAAERTALGSSITCLRKDAEQFAAELAAERQHNRLLKQREAALTSSLVKLGNSLSQANSRLGRERSIRANCEELVRALRQQASVDKSEMRRLTRTLEASDEERRDLLAKLKQASGKRRSGQRAEQAAGGQTRKIQVRTDI